MRKLNTILSVILILIFMIHGIMGGLLMIGVGSDAGKILARIGVAVLIVHTLFGALLTIRSFKAAKQSEKRYLRQNSAFWARRASGLAILILFFTHMGLFGEMQNGVYVLFPFTTVKLVTQLLLVAALFVHIFINVRPLLTSLGIIRFKERRNIIYLILSVLLLFISGSFIFYYIGWQNI